MNPSRARRTTRAHAWYEHERQQAPGATAARGPGIAEDDSAVSRDGEDDVVEIDDDGTALRSPGSTEGGARRRRRGRARGAAISVRAEGRTADGAVFVREAIVRVGVRRRGRQGRGAPPYEILVWRQGRSETAAWSDEQG